MTNRDIQSDWFFSLHAVLDGAGFVNVANDALFELIRIGIAQVRIGCIDGQLLVE